MSTQDIVLIHGTWGSGGNWGELADEMVRRGYRVHTPSWRLHGRPGEIDIWGSAQKVARLGLLDYVADLVALVKSLDAPPVVLGHSVGALLAQLVAARCRTRGLVLVAPAPAAGIFTFYPSSVLLWGRYIPQWLLGKPMYPVAWGPWRNAVCNAQSEEVAAAAYATLCAESGTAYREMIFWYLDRKRASRVDYAAVGAPVLVLAGSQDKCTPPGMCRATARRFGDDATYVEFEGSDHMMTMGPYLPQTLAAFDRWAARNGLAPGAMRGVEGAAR
ncbi:alpha/beta hydrolase [Zavarzinia aquatilis]|uniref:alpha/beta hydrolase n=1 Tax=Zavarzinia aquatilis TaxID=2211142 RepID=UPI0014021315|nr:alpha/beta fold hydrolase [Zavarzinia aquatilis]